MLNLDNVLDRMYKIYTDDPDKAVRGQSFIKELHVAIGDGINDRLTPAARKQGIRVVHEATVLGSIKSKDVDIAVIDPINGPLILIGVRSQMSSISKNVLTYFEGIVGECISLQDRFPLSVHGYVYLHPMSSIKSGKEDEHIDHDRYRQMYASITNRTGANYSSIRGVYDQFAYMVVNFASTPPSLVHFDPVENSFGEKPDLNIHTFVDRIIDTYNKRSRAGTIFTDRDE